MPQKTCHTCHKHHQPPLLWQFVTGMVGMAGFVVASVGPHKAPLHHQKCLPLVIPKSLPNKDASCVPTLGPLGRTQKRVVRTARGAFSHQFLLGGCHQD